MGFYAHIHHLTYSLSNCIVKCVVRISLSVCFVKRKETVSCKYPKNLTNIRFGRLTVKELVGRNKHHDSIWKCQCDCGQYCVTTRNHLVCNKTKSCGCLNNEKRKEVCTKRNTTHGKSNTRTYNQWVLMKRRCLDDPEKNPDYENYAGRGICYSEQWEIFENFLKDMGESPNGLELDRINNDQGYCKENCRWATRSRQTRNTRRNRHYDVNGVKMCMADIAEQFGINYNTLRSRLYIMKLSIEEALTYDKNSKKRSVLRNTR